MTRPNLHPLLVKWEISIVVGQSHIRNPCTMPIRMFIFSTSFVGKNYLFELKIPNVWEFWKKLKVKIVQNYMNVHCFKFHQDWLTLGKV